MHAVDGVELLIRLKLLSRVCDDDFAHTVTYPKLSDSLRECLNRPSPPAVECGGDSLRAVPGCFGRRQIAQNSEVTLMVFECF